jgi:hypothetical protein
MLPYRYYFMLNSQQDYIMISVASIYVTTYVRQPLHNADNLSVQLRRQTCIYFPNVYSYSPKRRQNPPKLAVHLLSTIPKELARRRLAHEYSPNKKTLRTFGPAPKT